MSTDSPARCSIPACVLAIAGLAAGFAANADMISSEGMAAWETCALCHSADGVSPMAKFPKLAGQKQAYIEKQFRDFQNGERHNDGGQMQAISNELQSAATRAEVANYFASLPSPPARALPQEHSLRERFEQGRRLYKEGSSGEAAVPACASCHSLQSSMAPWLYAQHRDYTVKQLRDFKQGERQNDAAQVMQSVANRLSDEEIFALGVYLESTALQGSIR